MKPVQTTRICGLGLARRRAFTLVEVLLAFLILMLGIIAVLALFPVGMKLSQEMVETSQAAIIAKNARGCMEATDLADRIAGDVGTIGGFPLPTATSAKYFPGDMTAIAETYFLPAINNTTVVPHIVSSVIDGRIVDSANNLYSWDARFDVGRGAFRTPWGFNQDDTRHWMAKYFRYYVVNISVYRGYKDVSVSGNITNLNLPTAGDANRIPYCQFTVSGAVPLDLKVGWYVRCPTDHSDWYRVQKMEGAILTLDRAYAGAAGNKTLVATGSLVGHYTSFIAAYND